MVTGLAHASEAARYIIVRKTARPLLCATMVSSNAAAAHRQMLPQIKTIMSDRKVYCVATIRPVLTMWTDTDSQTERWTDRQTDSAISPGSS